MTDVWDLLYEAEKRCRILGGRPLRGDDSHWSAWLEARREVDRLRTLAARSVNVPGVER